MRLSADRRTEVTENLNAAIRDNQPATERYFRKELAKLNNVGYTPYTATGNQVAPFLPDYPTDLDLPENGNDLTTPAQAGFGGWVPLALAAGAIWFFMYRK